MCNTCIVNYFNFPLFFNRDFFKQLSAGSSTSTKPGGNTTNANNGVPSNQSSSGTPLSNQTSVSSPGMGVLSNQLVGGHSGLGNLSQLLSPDTSTPGGTNPGGGGMDSGNTASLLDLNLNDIADLLAPDPPPSAPQNPMGAVSNGNIIAPHHQHPAASQWSNLNNNVNNSMNTGNMGLNMGGGMATSRGMMSPTHIQQQQMMQRQNHPRLQMSPHRSGGPQGGFGPPSMSPGGGGYGPSQRSPGFSPGPQRSPGPFPLNRMGSTGGYGRPPTPGSAGGFPPPQSPVTSPLQMLESMEKNHKVQHDPKRALEQMQQLHRGGRQRKMDQARLQQLLMISGGGAGDNPLPPGAGGVCPPGNVKGADGNLRPAQQHYISSLGLSPAMLTGRSPGSTNQAGNGPPSLTDQGPPSSQHPKTS